jgi:predicted nucleotidyltransferase
MRITLRQHKAIKTAVVELAGSDVAVRLFGSRLNDEQRGGDIDLLVSSVQAVEHPAWLAASITARLQMALGEQRIDVLIDAPNLMHQPIHDIARQGVLL